MEIFFSWLFMFIVVLICLFVSLVLALLLLRHLARAAQVIIDFTATNDLPAGRVLAAIIAIVCLVMIVPPLAAGVMTANIPPTSTATPPPVVIFVPVDVVATATPEPAPTATPAPASSLPKCRCKPVLLGNLFCIEPESCGRY